MGCVYMATNTENGKCYVGMTTRTLAQRRSEHLNTARRGDTAVFYNAIRKYGKEAFVWEILYAGSDVKKLFSVEQKFIDRFDCVKWGYNMCYGGAGVVPTEKLREHKSESTKALYQNPKYVENRMAGIREYWSRPEAKMMAKDRARKNAENPDWRKACKDSWTPEARERASERMKIRMAEVKKNDPEFFKRKAEKLSKESRELIAQQTKDRWEALSQEDKIAVADRLRETMKTDKWKYAHKEAMAKNRKSVLCVETGIIYPSIREAAEKCNTSNQNINAVLSGRQHKTRGLTFIYYNKESCK